MAASRPTHDQRACRFALLGAVTVGILFAQVWLRVDPRLIFHRQGPVFLTGWGFFGQHLDRPGGLTEYAAAFLSQLNALGWPGAAVLAAMAAAIALAGWTVFRRLGRRREILAAVPVVLLTVLATRYDHPMTTWVSLTAVLSVAAGYVWAAPRQPGLRGAVFLVLACLLYCNSDACDSYHSWSSNSRWIVFSSKRDNGVFARPYFSYIDPQGRASKPFVLPQEDPAFYDSCIQTFNAPELATGPVTVSRRAWADAICSPGPGQELKAALDPAVRPRGAFALAPPEDQQPAYPR